jgi:hypothetical protein
VTHKLISQEVWPAGLTEAWLGRNHPAMTSGMTENPQSEADLSRLLERMVEEKSDLMCGLESGSQDRWLLGSALQKAIRRGRVGIAVGTAREVFGLNASYLWRRLCVIALEDIGFGDPLTCALVLFAANNSPLRNKVGSGRVLTLLVSMLAKAVKDRTLCDLLNIEHFKLHREVAVPRKSFHDKVTASEMPFLTKYMALKGMELMRDPLYWAVPIQWEMLKAGPISVRVNQLPEDEMINGVIASGYDQHNSVGKRAIAYFAKACEPVRTILDRHPIEDRIAALGGIIFLVEGSKLDKQLDFAGMKGVYEDAQISDLHHVACMTNEEQRELVEAVKKNLAALDLARSHVARPSQTKNILRW